MGPGPNDPRPLPSVPGVDGAPDYVAEMLELQLMYKFDWLRPVLGDGGPHAATWTEEDGPVTERRDSLRELVLYVRAYFGRP